MEKGGGEIINVRNKHKGSGDNCSGQFNSNCYKNNFGNLAYYYRDLEGVKKIKDVEPWMISIQEISQRLLRIESRLDEFSNARETKEELAKINKRLDEVEIKAATEKTASNWRARIGNFVIITGSSIATAIIYFIVDNWQRFINTLKAINNN